MTIPVAGEAPPLWKRMLTPVSMAVVAFVLYITWNVIATWCQHFFGFANNGGNGSHYLFWSGVGSDLGYGSMLSAAVVLYRKQNCKRTWCWRLGHYNLTDPETGVTRMLCWKHHPGVKRKRLTDELILHIHKKATDALAKTD